MAEIINEMEQNVDQTPHNTLSSEIESILVRSGVPVKRYRIPTGTTVGDLLRNVSATFHNQDLFVGANQVQEDYILRDQDIVRVVPRPQNA